MKRYLVGFILIFLSSILKGQDINNIWSSDPCTLVAFDSDTGVEIDVGRIQVSCRNGSFSMHNSFSCFNNGPFSLCLLTFDHPDYIEFTKYSGFNWDGSWVYQLDPQNYSDDGVSTENFGSCGNLIRFKVIYIPRVHQPILTSDNSYESQIFSGVEAPYWQYAKKSTATSSTGWITILDGKGNPYYGYSLPFDVLAKTVDDFNTEFKLRYVDRQYSCFQRGSGFLTTQLKKIKVVAPENISVIQPCNNTTGGGKTGKIEFDTQKYHINIIKCDEYKPDMVNDGDLISTSLQPGCYKVGFLLNSVSKDEWQEPIPIEVTIDDPLSVKVDGSDFTQDKTYSVNCYGRSQLVNLAYSGGKSGVGYLWEMKVGDVTPDFKDNVFHADLLANTYGVKLINKSTDGKYSCSADFSKIVVNQPSSVEISKKVDIASCYGNPSTVTITATGGTEDASKSGFKYIWNEEITPVAFNGRSFSKGVNLSTENYKVKVLDANSCISNEIVRGDTEVDPSPVSFKVEALGVVYTNQQVITLESCSGTDGNILVKITGNGGYGALSLSQNNTTVSLGSNITLAPGYYSYLIKDGNNCNKEFSITVLPKFKVASSITHLCKDTKGAIALSPEGGSKSYTFTLNNQDAGKIQIVGPRNDGNIFSELFAGKYSYRVTDGYCPISVENVNINAPVTFFSASSTMDCKNDNSDILVKNVAGRNGIYQFELTKNDVLEKRGTLNKGDNTIADLNSGLYKLKVISDGCESGIQDVKVYNRPRFVPDIDPKNPACFDGKSEVSYNVIEGKDPKVSYIFTSLPDLDGKSVNVSNSFYTRSEKIEFEQSGKIVFTISDGSCNPSIPPVEKNIDIPILSIKKLLYEPWDCHTSNGVATTGAITVVVNTSFTDYTVQLIRMNGDEETNDVAEQISVKDKTTYSFTIATGGKFKVRVKSVKGCSIEVNTADYAPKSYLKIKTAIPTNPTCDGEKGKVVVEVGGLITGRKLGSEGVSPLVVDSVATFSDKSGTRIYRVNDGFCYLNTDPITLVDPLKPSFSSSIDNPPCNGDKAKVTFTNVAPVGGVYTYHVGTAKYDDASFMLPVVGSSTEVELSVVNEKGCASDARKHMIAMPDVLQSAFTAVPVRCNKGTDGKIHLGAIGGATPYTFTDGATPIAGTTYSELKAGSYTITVTDKNSCSADSTVVVSEPDMFSFMFVPNLPTCRNGENGSIALTIDGGNAGNYEYKRGNEDYKPLMNSIVSGLSPNTYDLTIKDTKGCEAEKKGILVGNQPKWKWDISTLDPTCSANGEIKINSIANGYGDYKYYKDNSTGASILQPLTNLAVGGHVVTVIDSKNCVQTTKPTLNDNALTVTTMPKHVTCYGGKDGAIEVTISGGRKNKDGAYTCKLMKGASEISSNVSISSDNQTITYSKLGEGTYTLSVSDASECRETKDITLTQFDKLIDFTVTPFEANTCQEKGRIEVSNIIGYQGVKSDLVFSAGNLVQKDNHTFIVYPGPYSVTVTDSKGCNTTKKIVLTPEQLTAELVPLPMDCSGNNNGSVKINQLKGGIGQLTTSCRLVSEAVPLDNEYKPQLEYGGLKPGKYIVYGRDENNRCKMSVGDFEVKDVEPLLLTYGYNSPTCNGYSDAVVNLQVTGGNGAYALNAFGKEIPIAEENGKIGGFAKVEGIKAGSYPINLTDKNSCPNKGTDNIVVNEPDPITLNLEKADDVDCKGNANGRIYLTAQGGNGRYTYTTTKDGAAYKVDDNQIDSYLLDKLSPATYAFDVKDRKGCLLTSKIPAVTIAEPNLLTLAVDSFADLTCYKNATGSITVKPSGGNAGAMKYAIGGGALQESPTFGSLAMGNYSLTVKDSKGCTAAVSKSLAEPTLLEVTSLSLVNPSCFEYRGSIIPALKGGTAPYYTKVDGYGSYAAPAKVELPDGSYTLWYKDANGCEFNHPLKIVQPQKLEVSEAIKAPLCTGFDGKVTLAATGGTSKYEFLLGAAGYSATSEYTVKKGSYGISVKDAQGCIASKDITVDEPLPLTLASEYANPLCNGLMGSITLNAGGGTAPYSYTNVFTGIFPSGGLIEGGSSQKVAFGGLKPNVAFTPAVRDAHGCMLSTAPITLAQPDALSWQPDIITNLKCAGDASGVAKVEVVGGTVPYTYSLNGSENGDGRFSRLGGGMYNVKASDSHGCTLQKSISLFEPTPLTVNTSLDVQRCFTLCDGRIAVYPAGGTIPYTISWNNPTLGSSNMLTNLCGGAYLLNVKDGNGCEVSKDLSFATPEQILINVGFKDTILCKGQTIKVAPQPDRWGLMWLHNSKFLANGSSYVVTSPGSYTVKAIDAKGCTVDFGFGVTYLNDAMNPDFLISSKVAATDTIVVVDISNPKPTLVDWKYDSNARIIEKNDRYLYLAYDKPGIYTLGMVAHAGSCATSIEKRIEVGPKEDRFEINKSLGAKDNILKSFKLYPNPTSGVFKVKVVLNRPADIRLQIMSISNGVLLDTKELRGTDTYEVEFDRQDLKQGFYIINLTVEGQAFGLKMVKI